MRKLSLVTFILIFCFISASSQSCFPDGIEFNTQEQIDNFQFDYPNCTEIIGSVRISGSYYYSSDIVNLNGLSVLTSIGSGLFIHFNDALTSLSGLENVTSIGGHLTIYFNDALTSLLGLENIEANSIEYLGIISNHHLSHCSILSICNYLNNPSGDVSIAYNATGCHSSEEIQDSCYWVSVDDHYVINNLLLFPNPATHNLNIKAKGMDIDKISISNLTGQLVLKARPSNKVIDVSGLQSGMYILEAMIDNTRVCKKLFIQR